MTMVCVNGSAVLWPRLAVTGGLAMIVGVLVIVAGIVVGARGELPQKVGVLVAGAGLAMTIASVAVGVWS